MRSAHLLAADPRTALLIESPLLTTAEVERRLRKVAAHQERHARRPLLPADLAMPRTVPLAPRRRHPGFHVPTNARS